VRAATGRDVAAEIGGWPNGWREAASIYRRLGVRTLAEAVSLLLGPPIPTRRARRGDVVMAQGSLGICRGEVAMFLGGALKMREIEAAWSVHGKRG
jgi:Domain of unknown function (DUF6950)